MADVLDVRVVSPEAVVFEGQAVSLVVAAWDGKLGVLPGHAPLIALLGGGDLDLDLPDGGSETFFLDRGVIKVENDQVTILSEYASREAPPEFDSRRAWLELEEEAPTGPPDADVATPVNPLA